MTTAKAVMAVTAAMKVATKKTATLNQTSFCVGGDGGRGCPPPPRVPPRKEGPHCIHADRSS